MRHRVLILLLAVIAISSSEVMATDSQGWIEEDIAVFRDRFLAVDKSFSPESRAKAEARLKALKRRFASVKPAEFVVEVCRIAALAGNAHTRCMSKASAIELCRQWALISEHLPPDCEVKQPALNIPDFNSVAIGFRPFLSEFHVISVTQENADLLGARMLVVNGKAVEEARPILRSFSAGSAGYRDLRAAAVLATPQRLYAAGLGDRPDSVTYEFLTTTGRKIERTFEVSLSSEPMAQRLPNALRVPWAMQDPDVPFRFRDAPDKDAVIIQLRQNVDSPNEKINVFLQNSEATRARLGRKNVVLDMRFNGGGNLDATRDFMVNWPSLVPGRFYVLTGPQTFSAGIVAVAYLKQSAGDRMVIVGEPVGDELMFFSDGVPVRLPNSGLTIYMAQVRIDLRDGCRKYDDCHASISQPGRVTAPLPAGITSIKRMPVSVENLEPDVRTPWTLESWINGGDPMIEAVASLLRKD